MRRRIFITLLLVLSGGAIVNIAVAWGCAIYGKIDRSGTAYLPDQAEHSMWNVRTPPVVVGSPSLATRSHSFGFAAIHLVADRPPDSTLETTGDEDGLLVGMRFNSHAGRPDVLDGLFIVHAGWPMRSLEGRRWHLNVPVGWHMFETGFAIQRGGRGKTISEADLPVNVNTTKAGEYRMLPLRPLWSGFLINTVFYAALLWLLFAAPFAARRMIRRRRGLCANCGYPVGVNPVCTECGAAVRPAQRAGYSTPPTSE